MSVMQTFLRIFAGLLCSMWWVGTALGANAVIVASEPSAGYASAAAALSAELARVPTGSVGSTTVVQWSVAQWRAADASSMSRTHLVVALGTEALRQVLATGQTVPILAALIPRSGVEHVLKEQGRSPGSIAAVYLDQPFGRQLELLRLAMPEAHRVGVIWGPESITYRPVVSSLLRGLKLQEVAGVVATTEPLQKALKAALTDADVLLAVADPYVFNSTTVSNILLASYRAGVPVMAFSPAYARAGALLALYSTPEQIGLQAGAIARTILSGGALPAPQYPLEFRVDVNENVARSLGLSLDETALLRRLRQSENLP